MNRALLVRLLQFAGLSGLGWLLDVTLLLVLVGAGALPPFAANVVSSATAALGVFLLSRRFIFDRDRRHLAVRTVLYLAYTLCVILLAAAALHVVVDLLAAHQALWPVSAPFGPPTPVLLAFVAKVAVTPPQLLLNFAVARLLSERAVRPETRPTAHTGSRTPWPTRS